MKIVYDMTLRRPGCVLLQAMGGTVPDFAKRFPSESWLVAPTAGMKLYEVTTEQLESLLAITEAQLAATKAGANT